MTVVVRFKILIMSEFILSEFDEIICATNAIDSGRKSFSIEIADTKAAIIPISDKVKSPSDSTPKSITKASTRKILTELLRLSKFLQSMKLIISVPPVEPPPEKVRAHPAPVSAPPKTAARRTDISLCKDPLR